jgi:chemotaxis protein methyltransferase CheR
MIRSGHDAEFARIKEHLISATGMEYYAHRDEELCGRIAERMAQRNLPDMAAYFKLLQQGRDGADELDRLIEQTTVGETYFFRHRELFDALRETVLPEIIERRRDERRLRIWSAGCSVGAEPYSVSILLKHELVDRNQGWDVTILGTDINNEFLAEAAQAEFDEWVLRDVPPPLRQTCFDPCGKRWRLKEAYKEGVSFQRHNLVQDAFRPAHQE